MNFNYEEFIAPHARIWNDNQKSKRAFYKYVIEKLVSKKRPLTIIETGTMWTPHAENAGGFTMIMGDLLTNHTGGTLITVDISQENLDKCKKTTEMFAKHIEYVCSDSVAYLKSSRQVEDADLLFLDSYDLYIPDPELSQIHHFRELIAAYDNLRSDVIIAVDDNFLPGTEIYWDWYDDQGKKISTQTFYTGDKLVGKGTLVNRFLLDQGWRRFDNLYVGENNTLVFER
jgi:hypothetical protein